MTQPSLPETPPPDRSVARTAERLRDALRHADPGTLAALRRTDPERLPAAFFRLTVDLLDEVLPAEAGPSRDRDEIRWAAVTRELAHAGDKLLAPVPLGEALAKAGVAEMRVLRLLQASGATLFDTAHSVVQQLVSRGQPFDPRQLAELVVREDSETVRRRIARDFYRHQDR